MNSTNGLVKISVTAIVLSLTIGLSAAAAEQMTLPQAPAKKVSSPMGKDKHSRPRENRGSFEPIMRFRQMLR